MLLDHLDGILNYCRTKVPLGVVEAVNGNIKSLLRRGRGYKNLRYLLAEGPAYGRDPDRIRGFQESSLKCGSRRIPAENPILNPAGTDASLFRPAQAGLEFALALSEFVLALS